MNVGNHHAVRHLYEFGVFRLDPAERIFARNGERVPLAPKAFDTLVLLVQNSGRLMTKDLLIATLWPDSDVEEGNLTQHIASLRRALGGEPSEYIETVPKQGYRFVCRVREIAGDSPSSLDAGESGDLITNPAIGQRSRGLRKRRRIVLNFWIEIWLLCIGGVTWTLLESWTHFTLAPQLRVVRYSQLTSDGRAKDGSTLLTDGARVYFDESGPEGSTLAAVSKNGGGTERIPLPLNDARIYDLSPQGSEFLVGRPPSEGADDAEFWVAPVGGSPRRVGNLQGSYARWSPDLLHIAFTQHQNVFVANADGSEAHRVASVYGQAIQVHWSPDGKKLRFTEYDFHDGELSQSIWEVAADGSDLHPLLKGWNDHPSECCGVWTPSGKFYVFQSGRGGRNDLWAIAEPMGLFGGTPSAPVRVSYGLQGFEAPIASAGDNEVFAIGQEPRGELVRLDSKLQEFVPFLGGISATWVSFAKSRKMFAYVAFPDSTLWRANADGSNKMQITFAPLQVDGLSWSPDGNQIAIRARNPGEPWRVYLMSSQGGTPQLLAPAESEQGVPTWSANGKEIAFGDVPLVFGKPSGTEAIHVFDLSTRKLTGLPGSRGLWTARWSPDGRFIAALTIVGQKLMIYDVAKEKWRQTEAKDINSPNWSVDSKSIYFDTEGKDRLLCRATVADGKVVKLADLSNYLRLAESWSGLAPDDSPLILRNLGTSEIYSLTLESH